MVFHNGHCKIRWCGIWWKSAGTKYVSPQNQVCWVQICLSVKFSEILGVLHAAGNTNLYIMDNKMFNPQNSVFCIIYTFFLYDICKYIIKDKSILITVIIYIYIYSIIFTCMQRETNRERERVDWRFHSRFMVAQVWRQNRASHLP